MTWPVARAVLLTAFLCGTAALLILRRNERQREGLPSRHPVRRHRPMAPRHPDRYAVLSDEDRGAWEGIEAGLLGDVGLAIFDSDEREGT